MTLNRVVTEDQIRGYYTRAEGGDLTFTAVTSGVKRDGLDLDVAGLSTDNFMRNPVVLWVHDYAGQVLPIGRVTSLSKDGGSLIVRIHFDDGDPFAQEIRRKYVEGYLNAVSVGWDTLETDGNRIVLSDLLDVSAVPVPGDQDALLQRAEEYARSLRSEPTIAPDSTQAVSEDEPEPRPLRAATVEQVDEIIIMLQKMRDDMEPQPMQAADETVDEALVALDTLLGDPHE